MGRVPAGQGVLVMRTVMLEASCPAQLPRAGRLGAGEFLVTLWPTLMAAPTRVVQAKCMSLGTCRVSEPLFHQGSVWPMGLSAEQLPPLHTS